MVEVKEEGKSDLETIIEEVLQEKIAIDYENCDISHPKDLEEKRSK